MAWKGNQSNLVPNSVQENVNRSEGRVQDNRAYHTNRESDKLKNFTITIKDIDETVFQHLQKMQLNVVDSGNTINVPISYASSEKWKAVRNDGFMRDNNGRIILPALIFYRTNSEVDRTMAMFNKYLRYSVMKMYSPKNQYTKFSVLENKNTPLNEVYNVVMPDHMVFNYKFILWTEYVEQMNSLIEKINFETNDYWGSSKNGLRFRTFIDSYVHTTELQSDSDRLIKTEFDLSLKGYLLPDLFAPGLDGFKSTTEKTFTPKKVILGTEIVSSDWKPSLPKVDSDKWRNQKYPNLPLGLKLMPPSVSLKAISADTITRIVNSITQIVNGTSNWHFPAPTSSTDSGEEGWASYDSDYYYIYTGGRWKRVPIVMFSIAESEF